MNNSEEILNTFEEMKTPEVAALNADEEALLKEMMSAAVFYGLTKSRTQPKMRPYIISTRAGIEIIDLLKTIEALGKVTQVIKDILKNKGLILTVGTTPAVKQAVKGFARRLGSPHVTERWLGGTLTNFKTISQRINYFKKLKSDKAAGALDKYTKKERMLIDLELGKLETLLSGIEDMDKLPALVFVIDLKAEEGAAREAKRMNIPIVALVNTNANPDLADYPIPANTRNPQSVQLLLSYLEKEIAKIEGDVQSS